MPDFVAILTVHLAYLCINLLGDFFQPLLFGYAIDKRIPTNPLINSILPHPRN